ncbi:MAG: hypothetical protein ACM3H8_15830 [Sphingobacteriales bacterium]
MKSLMTYGLITLSGLNILEIIVAAQLSFLLFTFTMALVVAKIKQAYNKE